MKKFGLGKCLDFGILWPVAGVVRKIVEGAALCWQLEAPLEVVWGVVTVAMGFFVKMAF